MPGRVANTRSPPLRSRAPRRASRWTVRRKGPRLRPDPPRAFADSAPVGLHGDQAQRNLAAGAQTLRLPSSALAPPAAQTPDECALWENQPACRSTQLLTESARPLSTAATAK